MFRRPALSQIATAAAAAIPAVEADGSPVKRVQLLPLGNISCRDGRKFKLADASAAATAIETSRAYHGRTDIVVDYDHHSEGAQTKGTRSIASGWIDPATLSVEDDGIYGDIAWTGAGAAHLAAREYRYLSPTFWFDKLGNVLGLKSVALLNNPAIDELAALAATQETVMLTDIALKLGLPETATAEEIIAAIGALQPADNFTAMAAALSTAATGLGLSADAAVPDVLAAAAVAAAASAGAPDPTKFVPIEQLTAVNAKLVALEGAATATAATAAVDAAVASGKIAPASRDHFLKSAEKDLPGFVALAATMPVILGDGEVVDTTKKDGMHGLTEAELTMCTTMGVTPEQFLKAKDA